MGILDVKIVQDYIRMCTDGWEQGWHERNGGNLTYRMRPEDVGRILRTFKIKKNVEVTDNGKIII